MPQEKGCEEREERGGGTRKGEEGEWEESILEA